MRAWYFDIYPSADHVATSLVNPFCELQIIMHYRLLQTHLSPKDFGFFFMRFM
jgi:hypothetical protein